MSADPKHIDKTDGTGYLDQAAKVVRNARSAAARSVNLAMVYAYFEVSRIVVEEEQASDARAEYGGQALTLVSEHLTAEFGRGFSRTNVAQMRQFYRVYAHDEIVQTVSEQFGSKPPSKTTDRKFFLSWPHYLRLMRTEDADKRHFYEIEATRDSWSVRELQRQLDSSLYERLALSRDKDGVRRLAVGGQIVKTPVDAIKDPYVLEFLGLKEEASYSESDLETRIIDHLQEFLLELGRGYAFVGRQQRFTYEEDHFKVDLVFYNRLLRCFVLFDLKPGKLTHQDIGQMQMYVHYYDRDKSLGRYVCGFIHLGDPGRGLPHEVRRHHRRPALQAERRRQRRLRDAHLPEVRRAGKEARPAALRHGCPVALVLWRARA